MDIHKNARLTPHSRAEVVCQNPPQVGRALPGRGLSWQRALLAEGSPGRGLSWQRALPACRTALVDRTSCVSRHYSGSRRQRWTGQRIAFSQILPDKKKASAVAFLKAKTPISRLVLSEDKLLRLHS